MSLLVLCKILRLFLNILTADGKYSLLNRDNSTQPIQILLCQKKKTFSHFFSTFLKSTLNFELFQTKMTLIADVFSKLLTPKNVIRSVSKKSFFKEPLEKQHGKRDQTSLQSRRQHCYHIY